MRTLSIHREAFNFLRGLALDAKRFRQVVSKLLALLENPAQADARPLRGHDDLWRVDVGEYRIVYRYDDEHVWIDVVGKRNDDEVYRGL